MKSYYEDKEYLIPYKKVLFCQWMDELGEMVLKINFQNVQGGDSFWRLSLIGENAKRFLQDYRSWLDTLS